MFVQTGPKTNAQLCKQAAECYFGERQEGKLIETDFFVPDAKTDKDVAMIKVSKGHLENISSCIYSDEW